MSKTAYALGFMALCGVILVIHEQTSTENIKAEYSEDPFLASVEKHVVATAQRRLKHTFHKLASDKHISEARKAIKAALMDADENNQFELRKARAERLAALEVDEAPKKVKKVAKKSTAKQYTWDELQNGNADKVEKVKAKKKVASDLMHNLLAAPKVDKTTVDEDDETVMVTADDEVKEVDNEDRKEAQKVEKAAESEKTEEDDEVRELPEAEEDEEEVSHEDDEEEEVQEEEPKKSEKKSEKKSGKKSQKKSEKKKIEEVKEVEEVEEEAVEEPKKTEASADDEVEEENFTEEKPTQLEEKDTTPVPDDDFEDDDDDTDYEAMM